MHPFRFDVDLSFGGEIGNTVCNLVAVEFRVCFDFNEVNAAVFPLYHGTVQGLGCRTWVLLWGFRV
jgi:hypothetical protein